MRWRMHLSSRSGLSTRYCLRRYWSGWIDLVGNFSAGPQFCSCIEMLHFSGTPYIYWDRHAFLLCCLLLSIQIQSDMKAQNEICKNMSNMTNSQPVLRVFQRITKVPKRERDPSPIRFDSETREEINFVWFKQAIPLSGCRLSCRSSINSGFEHAPIHENATTTTHWKTHWHFGIGLQKESDWAEELDSKILYFVEFRMKDLPREIEGNEIRKTGQAWQNWESWIDLMRDSGMMR
jgi:hypothetical protein